MSSIFQSMYSKAAKKCDMVADAREKCESARTNILTVLKSVQDHWQGLSGSAYYEALSNWKTSLDRAINRLNELEAQMRSEASEILSAWPQEAAANKADQEAIASQQ